MIELKLEDTEFENNGITHERHVARAIVLEDDKILILKVKRNDEFGNSTYLETSGGGVDDGETPEEAVLREIDEELGVKGEIITKLGIIDDYYNKIKRHNINHYYLIKVIGKTNSLSISEEDRKYLELLEMKLNYY